MRSGANNKHFHIMYNFGTHIAHKRLWFMWKSFMELYLSLGIPRGLFDMIFLQGSELQEYFFPSSIIASKTGSWDYTCRQALQILSIEIVHSTVRFCMHFKKSWKKKRFFLLTKRQTVFVYHVTYFFNRCLHIFLVNCDLYLLVLLVYVN